MGPMTPVLRGARIANSFAFGLQGFFFAVVLTQLPQQKDRFELTDGLIAGSVVLVSILAGLGSVAAEQLATRLSSRTTVRIGLLLITVTGCTIAMAPNTPVLLVTLGLYGIAVGIVDASTNMQAVFIQHAGPGIPFPIRGGQAFRTLRRACCTGRVRQRSERIMCRRAMRRRQPSAGEATA